jgi:predicted membrane-bound mannosyltransferase
LNGILLFLIFYFITTKLSYSFFIALFFSIHPSHVEAVSWVSGRTDLLASLFIFSAMLFFILFIKKERIIFYFISTLCFIAALLSKENAVLFPLTATALILMAVLDKSFCGGPGGGFFKKSPLAAGGTTRRVDPINNGT